MSTGRFLRLVSLVGALVLALGTIGLAIASTTTLNLVTVSGPSPLASCAIGGPGTNYVNAEVEPFLAVNPTNSPNLVGVWQQDRWDNGGAHGLVAGYSVNGGKTWQEVTLPLSACAGGAGTLSYERASDPWVSFGPDGTLYAVSISFNQSNNFNSVAATTSSDGGKTWSAPKVLIADNEPNFQFFNDKESVTADPTRAGVAYAVWDRLIDPQGNPQANLHTSAYTGPAMFARTTDGGQTWSAPQVIVNTKQRWQTIANQIVVDPRNDTLYDFFDLIGSPNGVGNTQYTVAYVKSTDGGNTWTQPFIIANLGTVYVSDPNTGAAIRTGDIIPEPAIDPANGKLYVVWQDARFNGGHYDEVALSSSSDGGATWTAPIRVNPSTGRPAFTPSVHVNSRGAVGVTYYDFRHLTTQTTTLPTDYWLTTSTDGGATFGNEVHLAGSFDMLTAPYSSGYFVGDYEGLSAVGTTFLPFFVQANSGNLANRTDVFAALER